MFVKVVVIMVGVDEETGVDRRGLRRVVECRGHGELSVGGRWSRQGGMIESRMGRLRAREEGIALQMRRKRKQGGRKRKVGKGETEELEVDGGECC